jgi:ribose transport system permease protein
VSPTEDRDGTAEPAPVRDRNVQDETSAATEAGGSFTISSWVGRQTAKMFLAVGVLPFLLLILIVVFGLIESRFLSSDNLFNVSRQSTFLVIVATGQAIVIMAGGFDLSVGGTIALTSVVSATVMTDQIAGGSSTASAITVAVLAGLAVGLVVGAANGLAVAALRVPPFVVTLGMTSVAYGLALIVADGVPVRGLPREFTRTLGTGSLWGIAAPVWIAALVVVVMVVVMNMTRFGRYVYAIGGNEKAARFSGVPVGPVTMTVYVASAVLSSAAGLLLTARVSSGEPNLGGEFALESIAAAVLGGVALGGGEGRLLGAIGGAVFVVLVKNGMNLIRIQSFVQMVVLGFALVLAVSFDRLRDRVRARL